MIGLIVAGTCSSLSILLSGTDWIDWEEGVCEYARGDVGRWVDWLVLSVGLFPTNIRKLWYLYFLPLGAGWVACLPPKNILKNPFSFPPWTSTPWGAGGSVWVGVGAGAVDCLLETVVFFWGRTGGVGPVVDLLGSSPFSPFCRILTIIFN